MDAIQCKQLSELWSLIHDNRKQNLEQSQSKGQIRLRYPGRRQVRSWSQTCSKLQFGLRLSSLLAG